MSGAKRCDQCKDGRVPPSITVELLGLFGGEGQATLACAFCEVRLSNLTLRKILRVKASVVER